MLVKVHMRIFLLTLLLCGSSLISLEAQTPDGVMDRSFDQELYDEQIRLTELMYWAQYGDSTFDRNDANYLFIRGLVRSLRIDGAFDFPFDSLRFISKLYTPDRKYRIFTWQVKQEMGTMRHFGCILTNEKPARVIPLLDRSDEFLGRDDTTFNHKSWYGAAYFQVVPEIKKVKGVTYYTLIGYDQHEPFSRRKMIELLWFDKQGVAYFGAPLFQTPKGTKHRYYIEYAADVTAQLRYEASIQRIVFDNLVPRHAENTGYGYDDVPDGSFNAFVWKKSKWMYQDNVDVRMPEQTPKVKADPNKKSGLQKP